MKRLRKTGPYDEGRFHPRRVLRGLTSRVRRLRSELRFRSLVGPPDVGIDGWLGLDEARLLYHVGLVSAGNGAEIGSWCGRSAYFIAAGIRDRIEAIPGKLYCIDTFEGSDVGTFASLTELNCKSTFEIFVSNLERAGLRAYVDPIVRRSIEAAALIEEGSLSFVFIDGDHSYDSALEDSQAWIPRVQIGGLVAFHDSLRATVRPVWERDFADRLRPMWLLENTTVCRRVK